MELILENVAKQFDEKVILESANFTFETGNIYGLLGRNGAGKTTLFNCIAKNIQLNSGQILLDQGVGPQNYDNTDIGYVYTIPHLPAFMTAVEFVKFFMDINKDRLKDTKTAADYLSLVGIAAEDQHRLLKDFSHGMQNKVQMVVSLMITPPILLMDEPLTSFDVVAAHEMKELILAAKKDSIVIFSTHILQLAQDLCDEIVLLNRHQLQTIPAENIHDADFEEEIIQLLRDPQEEV